MSLRSKMIITAMVAVITLFGVVRLVSLPTSSMIYGVSFSSEYAGYLGFDYKEGYATILDDWKFKYLRLSAQWDSIESARGSYDFRELDWLMDQAAARGAKVLLAVGRKTPRWPECHLPEWAERLTYNEYKEPLREFISRVVERYGKHPALEMWQVENEPFLSFGLCQTLPRQDYQDEVRLVKSLDAAHPTMATDSGELSLWLHTARAADLFGTTMYRVVWNKGVGYWSYKWLPAMWYKLRLWANRREIKNAYVVELQAEPWIPNGALPSTTLDEQYRSMNLTQLKKNILYAEKTGMGRAYLWGAEWWYWLKFKGKAEIAEYVKTLKKE